MKYLLEGIGWRTVLLMMADQISYKPGSDKNDGKSTPGKSKKKVTKVTSKEELLKKIKQDAKLWE